MGVYVDLFDKVGLHSGLLSFHVIADELREAVQNASKAEFMKFKEVE